MEAPENDYVLPAKKGFVGKHEHALLNEIAQKIYLQDIHYWKYQLDILGAYSSVILSTILFFLKYL